MDRNARLRGPDAQLNLAWWLDHLGAAADEPAVVEMVREFMRAWPREKIDALPPAYRPRRLETADEISEYAVVLARAQLKGDHRAPHMHAMAIFFTEAAMRLSRFFSTAQRERERRVVDLDEEN